MSLRPDGSYRCDRCDTDVANGGVPYAVTISGIDPADESRVRVLHLCLPREVDGERVPGCRDRVLTRRALAAYLKTKTKTKTKSRS